MKLMIASNNEHKIREIKAIVGGYFDEVLSQREAGVTLDVEANGSTFAENALLKARKIYDFITTQAVYRFMPPYLTVTNIPEYFLSGLRGDCGVQAITFVTLCRLCGVPAQWQSGLYTKPDSAGHHDWARFYVAPFGWLFADCSFGGSAYRAGDLDRWNFYFGNLEPWRMPTCSAFQQEFNPPRRFLRYDPYDNQSGDVESLTRRLYADEYEHDCRVLRYEEME